MSLFPDDSAERKTYPVYSGLLAYFPSALAAVARHSYLGNEKHNPGQPLHHDRAKSGDELDAMIRHAMEGDFVGMAWRALSQLQKHMEANGSPIAPAARNATTYEKYEAQHHAIEAPMPPSLSELLTRAEDDDGPDGLKAGEAYREAAP
jgi:hypothetical protein